MLHRDVMDYLFENITDQYFWAPCSGTDTNRHDFVLNVLICIPTAEASFSILGEVLCNAEYLSQRDDIVGIVEVSD